ncbi:sugar transporter [Rodentibacter caecimuris]|uniref:Sugar transporter n=1 Tax=Rodentibacter caecimuris TaxID=1796644 RepID=A0ABX3KV10_9PAST|nr:sugar transporter [Rodentibacter heylii]
MLSTKKTQQIQYWRVFIMACAAFIFNTTEFVPIALLSDIGQSFQMNNAQVGLMMTVYAWTVLTMSLPAMLATGKLERRGLLLKLFLIFIFGHILSIIAWNFWILLTGRIIIALAHAVFWSITASIVMRLAPKNKKTQALALLSIGTALAAILGLPLGRIIGQAFGWRITFAIIATMALIIMLIIAKLLPRLPSKNAGSLHSLPILAKRPLLIGLYLTTMLVISAHFTAYTYIEPFMIEIGQLASNLATLILLIFGISGIVAGLLFNRLQRFGIGTFLSIAIIILIFALCSLQYAAQAGISMFGLAFLWGIGISSIGLILQLRILQLAPDATDVATAIFSGIYNAGIGAGALFGNQVMIHFGLENIGFFGAFLGLTALCVLLFINRKYLQL